VTKAKTGRLLVVGTGILREGQQASIEVLHAIKNAEKVFFGSHSSQWVKRLNPTAEDLHSSRAPGKDRRQAYTEMVERILAPVRQGQTVVACFYGCASIATWPANLAVFRAQREGYPARMLPGISSINSLFCDLNIDPGDLHGCTLVCAHNYVRNPARFDSTAHLVLWQINMIQSLDDKPNPAGVSDLTKKLAQVYGDKHIVVLYEASQEPARKATTILPIPLASLPEASITTGHTLYVPPIGTRALVRREW